MAARNKRRIRIKSWWKDRPAVNPGRPTESAKTSVLRYDGLDAELRRLGYKTFRWGPR